MNPLIPPIQSAIAVELPDQIYTPVAIIVEQPTPFKIYKPQNLETKTKKVLLGQKPCVCCMCYATVAYINS